MQNVKIISSLHTEFLNCVFKQKALEKLAHFINRIIPSVTVNKQHFHKKLLLM